MTTREIISLARGFLKDTKVPYRWKDFELKKYLGIGIQKLNSIRPDTRYVNFELTDRTILPDDDTAEIALDYKFGDPLACHVVYMAYLQDDSDTVNQGLAEVYLSKFTAGAQL